MDTNQTLDELKKAQGVPLPEDIAKAFTQSGSATTGLTAYDLEGPAKTILPMHTPLRNRIARVSGKGGIQANWKAVTGINTNGISAGVSQGNRGGIIATSVADYFAAYRGLGLEDNVTFEADYSAEYYDDVKARATEGLLRSLMIGEENILLGGNTSVALGTTPTPTLVGSTTGGALAAATYSIIAVALTYDAYWAVAGQNQGNTGQSLNIASAVVPAAISRTNADGTVDTYGGGSARKSTAATVATSGSTGSIAASVAAVAGAFAYAWYWGAAGSEVLGAITTINSVSITAAAAGAQTAASMPASDNSTNALVFDGLLPQILKAGSGAYVKVMANGVAGTGTPLTADGAGGIVEFDEAFAAFWDKYRLSPDTIYMGASDLLSTSKKIVANGGAPLIRFNMDAGNPSSISAGVVVGSILNKITGTLVKVEVHPTMPTGTVMFFSSSLPYTLSGITNILQVRTRREYYQLEWPLRTRKYEYGVYADEVLQNYFPPAFGVITNIGRG